MEKEGLDVNNEENLDGYLNTKLLTVDYITKAKYCHYPLPLPD